MKRIGNVWEKIISYENLMQAHMRAKQGKSDYVEVQKINENPEKYLMKLHRRLKNGDYKVRYEDYIKKNIIDKGKPREIMKLPYYPHRIVQWAIMLQVQDRFLKTFILDTYASIEKRGLHFGAKRLKKRLYKDPEGTTYCLKLDMKKYYPSIDNKILFKIVNTKIKDKKLLKVIENIIFSVGEKGQPIGSLWSQWAGNLYLSELDHYVKEELKKVYYRYCDDIVLVADTKEKLREALGKIREIAAEKLNLKIKENYQIFPTRKRGIDFLGYRFFGDYILLRKRVLKELKRKLVPLQEKEVLTNSENSQINSYKGWLKFCDGFNLHKKYLVPLHNKIYINQNGDERRVNVYVRNRQKRKKNNNN